MTFDNFADLLVTSRVIAPDAISDPDSYDDKVVPWSASQTDVLADDWTVESPKSVG